jgi:HEAT repeat protein
MESNRPTSIACDDLATALRNPDPFVRRDALDRAGLTGAALEVVAIALDDEYPLVRREAVRALSTRGGLDTARVLMDVAAHDLSEEVRAEAIAALAVMLGSAEPTNIQA